MSKPTLHDTINDAHKQWLLMGEVDGFSLFGKRHVDKRSAYVKTSNPDTQNASGNDCHFCDYAGLDKNSNEPDCKSCPANGLWKTRYGGALTRCLSLGGESQYIQWRDYDDTAPMLDLIKRTADKHGVTLEAEAGDL